MHPITSKELSFSIFLLHKLSLHWQFSAADTYALLKKTNILDEYILANYETLHTLGTEYLLEDITEFARERGANV